MADSQMNVKGNSTTSTMGQILWRCRNSNFKWINTNFRLVSYALNNFCVKHEKLKI